MPINGITTRHLRERIENFYRYMDHQQLMNIDINNLHDTDLPPGWHVDENQEIHPDGDLADIILILDQTHPAILEIIQDQRLSATEISHMKMYLFEYIFEQQNLRAYENEDSSEGGNNYKLRKKTKKRRANKKRKIKTKRRVYK